MIRYKSFNGNSPLPIEEGNKVRIGVEEKEGDGFTVAIYSPNGGVMGSIKLTPAQMQEIVDWLILSAHTAAMDQVNQTIGSLIKRNLFGGGAR